MRSTEIVLMVVKLLALLAALLDGLAEQFPEVMFESRRPRAGGVR